MSFVENAQQTLQYVFTQPRLLEEALTHKSHLQGKTDESLKDNERLEFLGDAVLDLIISEYLAYTFPEWTEGDLSKTRANLVRQSSLAQAARRLQLGEFLRLGKGEEQTQGRGKSSLLANALEAVIAAIYLDGGLVPARVFVLQALEDHLKELGQPHLVLDRLDYKSQLQEWSQQQFSITPEYCLISESGPDHRKVFEVEVSIQGAIQGRGIGYNKKSAEQEAAKQAYTQVCHGNSEEKS
ncbi:MAG: ribonuclease III [Nitrospirae bacterium]|nr:ribonuclease III [Nitrospirota bacterium]MDA1302737.1 ribonuclease III [Nitrospirota bacterium]